MKYLFFTAIYLHYQYGWGLLYAKEDDGKTYTGFFQDNQIHQIDSENHTEGTDFFNSFVNLFSDKNTIIGPFQHKGLLLHITDNPILYS